MSGEGGYLDAIISTEVDKIGCIDKICLAGSENLRFAG